MHDSITPPTTDSSRALFKRSRLSADWPAPPRVHAITTLRGPAGVSVAPFDRFNLGMRCGDDVAAVARNRDALEDHLGLPSQPRWLRQVHGTTVATCDAVACVEEPEADAAITSSPGVVLAVLTADCMPVLFSSEDGSVVGAAHAGWRGLAAGVLENTIASMRTPPDRLLAWLGPAAGPHAYEIGEEVRGAFVSRDRVAEAMFVPTRPGHWLVNLYGLAILRLMDAGMPRMSIHGGDLCTISDPQRFFSHRRDGHTGRMASLIWINHELAGA
jgi:YfiH family protein